MNALDVRPAKWLQDPNYLPKVLYDDGEYSVIWGKYEGTPALGTRWNEGEDGVLGFPNRFGHAAWFVEPDFIATAIIQRLLTLAIDTKDLEYIDNLNFAIHELSVKIKNAVVVAN